MYFGGILIKALSQIIISLIVFISGFIAYRRLDWKKFEFGFVIIIGIVLLFYGCINVTYAIKPEIKQVNVSYNYQSSNGVIFGREYHFVDKNGNFYDLTMDPITSRKIFEKKEFNKATEYTITYEEKSQSIVGIETLQ